MTYSRIPDAGTRNWPVTLTLGLTFLAAVTIVPWYGFTVGFSAAAWIIFAVLLIFTGVGIGSGYHRLWSHRASAGRPERHGLLARLVAPAAAAT